MAIDEEKLKHQNMTSRAGRLALPLLALTVATNCLASDASKVGGNPLAALNGFMYLLWVVAYFRRRSPIGGWLLVYYFQLYVTTVISVLLMLVPGYWDALKPGAWENTGLYFLYLLSTVPVVLGQAVEISFATSLLFVRRSFVLRILRGVLVAALVASVTATIIDSVYFSESATLIFDYQGAVTSIIWMLYFFLSKRVHRVFVERTWVRDETRRIQSTAERAYLAKRATVAAGVALVVILVIAGISGTLTSETKDLILLAAITAAAGAYLGWAMPVTQRKLRALESPVSNSREAITRGAG